MVTQKTYGDQTSTYFYLFIIRITLKSTEKLDRLGREGDRDGRRWAGGVERSRAGTGKEKQDRVETLGRPSKRALHGCGVPAGYLWA